MGNSIDGDSDRQKKKVATSRFMHKIYEYMANYGRLTGEPLRQWINKTFPDNVTSVTYTKYAAPTTRANKEELIEALEKAYAGQWRPLLVGVLDVIITADREIIKYRWQNDVPSSAKPGERVKLYFETEAFFDKATGLWVQSIHNQYIPEPPKPSTASKIGSALGQIGRSYARHVSKNLDSNMEQLDNVYANMYGGGGGGYSSGGGYDASKQHRENMARQANDWNNYQRQQQQQAEQRHREAQTALSKRNNY